MWGELRVTTGAEIAGGKWCRREAREKDSDPGRSGQPF